MPPTYPLFSTVLFILLLDTFGSCHCLVALHFCACLFLPTTPALPPSLPVLTVLADMYYSLRVFLTLHLHRRRMELPGSCLACTLPTIGAGLPHLPHTPCGILVPHWSFPFTTRPPFYVPFTCPTPFSISSCFFCYPPAVCLPAAFVPTNFFSVLPATTHCLFSSGSCCYCCVICSSFWRPAKHLQTFAWTLVGSIALHIFPVPATDIWLFKFSLPYGPLTFYIYFLLLPWFTVHTTLPALHYHTPCPHYHSLAFTFAVVPGFYYFCGYPYSCPYVG